MPHCTIVTGIIVTNNQLDAQLILCIFYFDSLHVSSNLVLIIRRVNCIDTTSVICHCVSDRLLCRSGRNPTCTPDGHLHRVTYNRCIDTIDSPDDEHKVARNM